MTLTTDTTGSKPMSTAQADDGGIAHPHQASGTTPAPGHRVAGTPSSSGPVIPPSNLETRPLPTVDLCLEDELKESQAPFQFSQLEKARSAWLAEKQAAEVALDQRRQDLDRQALALVSRLQELYQREKRLADSQNAQEKAPIDPNVEAQRKLLEEKEKRLEEQERDLLIREADLRELRDVMEREYANKRGIMNQERLQLGRLREMLRIEQERFRAEVAKRNSSGESGPKAPKPLT
jgi:hypothetical protein